MIIDVCTYVWESPDQLGEAITAVSRRLGRSGPEGRGGPSGTIRTGTMTDHLTAAEPVDASLILGFKSQRLGADIPNEFISAYVREHPDRLVGIAGVDPGQPKEAIEEIRHATRVLGLGGVTLSPAAQDIHPTHSNAMRVYAVIAEGRLPLFINMGLALTSRCRMEFARPFLLDEIAREFPELKIVIGQAGHPWVDETFALLGKHKNVFADLAGLVDAGWVAYNSLVTAYQQGVMDKLLFASGFPFSTPARCIENLYDLNHTGQGTNLPVIPREQLRSIIERDALELLGISSPVPAPKADTSLLAEEDG